MTTNGQDTPVVYMENIVKRFGTITALEGVDFKVEKHQVMALLGDNGAGKSTLIKILTGVHAPTSGRIYFEGNPIQIKSPRDARDMGIETVYQDLALVNLMSITRNFFLGREMVRKIGPFNWLRRKEMNRLTLESLAEVGIEIRSPTEKVGKLSGGERQSIAIGRAMHFGAKLLILDEPTSALSVAETRKVLTYVTNAKERGLSVILITHNVNHAYPLADQYTIIRRGKKVGTYDREELSVDDVSNLITGDREV
jgi:simple sugar transport system ATP-binding protein